MHTTHHRSYTARAMRVVTDPGQSPLARLRAWTALKAARGQRVHPETLPTVRHAAPESTLAARLAQASPAIRRAVAQHRSRSAATFHTEHPGGDAA